MKIGIAVHGRFHAFDLARELLRRGHDVTLFTNLPAFVAERFGVPKMRVRSLVTHGAVSRGLRRFHGRWPRLYPEALLHRWFGRWVAHQVRRHPFDVVVCWSGVGEETFGALEGAGVLRVCMRGSAHIREQARLLEEEERRTQARLERPSPWIVAREEREYGLADLVVVPSSFARDTFLTHAFAPERLAVVPLGVDVTQFRPPPEVVEERARRIRAGAPLRVLNVGTFSYRKGAWDLSRVVSELAPRGLRFRFVGAVAPECRGLKRSLNSWATFVPPRPQRLLPREYAWGDLFVLATVEDGYAMVLDQALAAGLPLLATTNCAAPDLIEDGATGWVLPVRAPEAFVERLLWCDAHREELARMVSRLYEVYRPRDWAEVAADFEAACESAAFRWRGRRRAG